MSLASVAAGADGIMVEVHNQPEEALSDGAQSLYFDQFSGLINKLKASADAFGRSLDVDSKKILS